MEGISARPGHFDIQLQHSRDFVKKDIVDIPYARSEDNVNVADALPRSAHGRHVKGIGLQYWVLVYIRSSTGMGFYWGSLLDFALIFFDWILVRPGSRMRCGPGMAVSGFPFIDLKVFPSRRAAEGRNEGECDQMRSDPAGCDRVKG